MSPAAAHTVVATDPASGFGWSLEPAVVIPLVLVALLYANGQSQLAARRNTKFNAQDAMFWAGFLILALALVSPLHEAGTRVFTLHMIEHELLMLVASPLMVAARPAGALLWGLPRAWRGYAGWLLQRGPVKAAWRGASELWSATALHAVVLWVWHAPVLFHDVLENEDVHIAQHVSFIVSGLIFWSAIFRCMRAHKEGAAILALFVSSLQAGFLGALMTMSKTLWYPFAPDPFPVCGLTRGEDQALAGLVMWIPGCSVYVVVALIIMARWLALLGARRA
jgi:cytochrome c oxidase assembly factor CtaG